MKKITQDNQIYNHFSREWIDPYTWSPEDKPSRIKSILWGAIAAIGIFLISLTILIGIGG
jgi:hypothetical protein